MNLSSLGYQPRALPLSYSPVSSRRERRDCTDRERFVGPPSPLGELFPMLKSAAPWIHTTLPVEYRGAPPGVLHMWAVHDRTALSRARGMNIVGVTGIEPAVSASRTQRDTTSLHPEIFVAAGGLEPHPARLMKPSSRSTGRCEDHVSRKLGNRTLPRRLWRPCRDHLALPRTEGPRAPVIVKVVGHQHELPTCTRALAIPAGVEPAYTLWASRSVAVRSVH